VGTILARKWRIEERLGSGSSATVYRAEHWNNGRRVAVKVLHPDSARSAQSRTRFLREGRLANDIKHEGVVGVIDDGETDDGCPFLIMDLLEGETLDQQRKASPEGRLPIRDAVNACLAVLDVLAVAHEAGIVHRDIKPQNLFVTKSGRLKLLDFGIAGAVERGGTGVTRTSAGLGTPLFMAPEQITGDRTIDARADIWGVGATLYFLVAGRFPFERILLAEYLAATRERPPRLDAIASGVPAPIADVVERALAFEPAGRWPDAKAMSAALEKVLGLVPMPGEEAHEMFDLHTEQMVTLLRVSLPPLAPEVSPILAVTEPPIPRATKAPMHLARTPRSRLTTVSLPGRGRHDAPARRARIIVAAAIGGAVLASLVVAMLLWAFPILLP
jgi:serine/threonine-protein kinase